MTTGRCKEAIPRTRENGAGGNKDSSGRLGPCDEDDDDDDDGVVVDDDYDDIDGDDDDDDDARSRQGVIMRFRSRCRQSKLNLVMCLPTPGSKDGCGVAMDTRACVRRCF